MSRIRPAAFWSLAVIIALSASLALRARQTPPTTPAPMLAAGASHSLAVDSAGAVWAWGANIGGQVGDGTTQTRLAPVPVAALTGTFTAVAAGGAHSLARRNDGTVFAWGANVRARWATARRPGV